MSIPGSPQPATTAALDRLLSGRLLMRGSVFNGAGLIIPGVTALLVIPSLIQMLGEQRFGLLALAWTLVGYFSLFDLGLGRSLTQVVAQRIGTEQEHEIPRLARTTLMVMLVLGCLGGLVAVGAGANLIPRVLQIPASLSDEFRRSVLFLAAALPLMILQSGFSGLLAARQRFDRINAIRIPSGICMFAGPWAAAHLSPELPAVVGTILVVRLAACVAAGIFCRDILRQDAGCSLGAMAALRAVASQGFWITVSNVVGPLMVTADRFLIGACISVQAVTYYVAPYELATKLWLATSICLPVLFPAFAASCRSAPERARRLYSQAVRGMLLVVFPPALILVALAPTILSRWLGPEYADHGTTVLRVLAVGTFLNTLAQIPYALLQSSGQARWTATLHSLLVIPYLGSSFLLLNRFGIEAAAWLWTARICIDGLVLFVLAGRVLDIRLRQLPWDGVLLAGLLLVAAGSTSASPLGQIGWLLLLLIPWLGYCWFRVLSSMPFREILAHRFRSEAPANGFRFCLSDGNQTMDDTSAERSIRSTPRPDCGLCGCAGAPLYAQLSDRLFDAHGQWRLARCTNDQCRWVWLDPMPLMEDLGNAYLSYYTHGDTPPRRMNGPRRLLDAARRGYLANRYGYHRREASIANRLLGGLLALHPGHRAASDFSVFYTTAQPGGRLLDVGCGGGQLLSKLRGLGWEVAGVDFDPGAVAAARRKGLAVEVGALEDQTIPAAAFDVVTMSHVIEHVPDPVATIAEAMRVLKKGGKLIIATPNTDSFGHRRFGRDWLHLDPPRHLHLFNPATLRAAALQAGCDDIQVVTTLRDARRTLQSSRLIARHQTHAWQRRSRRTDYLHSALLEWYEGLLKVVDPAAGEELLMTVRKTNTVQVKAAA